MGAAMALRLKECGCKVTAVFDVRHKAARTVAEQIGAEHCKSLSKVNDLAEIVITVVSNDSAMHEVFDPESRSLLHEAQGKLFINCATVSPRVCLAVESLATKAGALCLEACMAGSVDQAREGKLFLMCGGSQEAFDRAKPLLAKLGNQIRYVGQAGQAAKLKALVNQVMIINTAALAEGLALADAVGLDLGVVRDVFAHTGADSRVLVTDGEDMQKRQHGCYFSAEHAAKDVGIALRLAREQKLHLPLTAATKKQYDRMNSFGLGDLDKSGISEVTFRERGSGKQST